MMAPFAQFIEGDYIRTREGLYFTVKGSRHPKDKVIAYLRYMPNKLGDRELNGIKYSRVYSIEETTNYLKKNYPRYINKIDWLNKELQSVPLEDIEEIYKPTEKLQQIIYNPKTKLESTLKAFVLALSDESGVPTDSIGVSGSQLISLANLRSDIDVNVYGKVEGRKVYDALKVLRDKLDWINSYGSHTVRDVLVSRWSKTGINLEKFVATETRKILHGKVLDKDYFIRLIMLENDSSTVIQYGRVKIRARITNTINGIYTPCSYSVDKVEWLEGDSISDIAELKSYRGKFTEQANSGDFIEAMGRLEEVKSEKPFFRVMLESEGDYLLLVEELL